MSHRNPQNIPAEYNFFWANKLNAIKYTIQEWIHKKLIPNNDFIHCITQPFLNRQEETETKQK